MLYVHKIMGLESRMFSTFDHGTHCLEFQSALVILTKINTKFVVATPLMISFRKIYFNESMFLKEPQN